jgi:hypothetical protein
MEPNACYLLLIAGSLHPITEAKNKAEKRKGYLYYYKYFQIGFISENNCIVIDERIGLN